MKAVVIGAGMSGLTIAAYLARAGYSVTLFEQFSQPGGVTATLRQAGFGWDLGPLLVEGFQPRERGQQVLEELDIAQQVDLIPGERAYHFPEFEFWPPDVFTSPNWRQQRLEEIFPREKSGIHHYYRFYWRTMQALALNKSGGDQPALRKTWQQLRWLQTYLPLRRYELWSAARLMDHFFRDPRLKAVFTSILTDFTTPPDRFPALAIPPLNSEHAFDSRISRRSPNNGSYPSHSFVHGGIGRLTRAVQSAFETAGGKLVASAKVAQILIDDYQVKGILLEDGRIEPADLVIASGGAQETFLHLVGAAHLPGDLTRQVKEMPRMESVLMVHLGLDFDPHTYQRGPLCYYFQHYDIQAAIEDCIRGIYKPGSDGFRIYIPSMHSPQMAPDGYFALTVYATAPNYLSDGDWDDLREEMANELLLRAERFIPTLRERAVTRTILTPADFRRRLNLQHHAYGGVAPLIGAAGIPHQTPIHGLWFIGAQSESGGGVPAVMSGARHVARKILQKA